MPRKPHPLFTYGTFAIHAGKHATDEVAKPYSPIHASDLDKIGIVESGSAAEASGILV
jgi:hypothetical protein